MKLVLILVTLFLGGATPLWASVQTSTHTYIVRAKDNAVLAINRQTGQEIRIPVGTSPLSLEIHEDRGYVLNVRSNNISVLDLKTNAVIQTIPTRDAPESMLIHGDKGYVMHWKTTQISVIDLKSTTEIQTISVGSTPCSMKIYGDVGYVVNMGFDLSALVNTGFDLSAFDHNKGGCVLVFDLNKKTVTQTIPVGTLPRSIMIYGDRGYVMNVQSNNISVIDLETNKVIQTIPVGEGPNTMLFNRDKGYVLYWKSKHVSVIDLKSNTEIQTISVDGLPFSMVTQGDVGYLMSISKEYGTRTIVIDLQTNRVVTTLENPKNECVDVSDTHLYLALNKVRPLYPTLASINLAKAQRTMGEFVAMMPKVFKLGEIEKRKFPKEKNEFDALPPFLLAQGIFWDVDTDQHLMDPQDILATLVMMKSPQKFLKTIPGSWLRQRLHMAFFRAVWVGDKDKVKAMLTYFVQLQDPVITNLATYTFKDPKERREQKATSSMNWVKSLFRNE